MKSFFKLLEKTAGPIGLLTATAGAILDFLTPLGNYIYLYSCNFASFNSVDSHLQQKQSYFAKS